MNALTKALNKTIKKSGDADIIRKAEKMAGKKIKRCNKCGHYYPKENELNHLKYCSKAIK